VSASLAGVAVVTGSSSGIGRAVAHALARQGMSVYLTGRDLARLKDCALQIVSIGARAFEHQADLSTDEGIRGLVERVSAEPGRVDVLVHAAGTLGLGNLEAARWDDLDDQYRRQPPRALPAHQGLPAAAQGVARAGRLHQLQCGAGAGSRQCALRVYEERAALAGRGNPQPREFLGVRVLSVFPGRTATPMQAAVSSFENRRYEPAELLQPEDVAEIIVATLGLPRTAEVTDIFIRPMRKPPSGRSQ
jgi:NADP-dependent 3-hydroxy acid dehydrogenase YdfG